MALTQLFGCVVASRTCSERIGESLTAAVEDGSNQVL